MDTWMWVLLIVVVAVVAAGLALGGYVLAQRRRSEALRDQFGPEYDRALAESGDRKAAESDLRERQERVAKLKLRPLSPDERTRFQARWKETQARFVDEPADAIGEADRLVQEAMAARGFPTGGDFEQRASDVSVEHPYVVEHYRAAHDIAARDGDVETEDRRVAMVHYRSLFEELVNAPGDVPATQPASPPDDGPRPAGSEPRDSKHRRAGRLGNIQRRG